MRATARRQCSSGGAPRARQTAARATRQQQQQQQQQQQGTQQAPPAWPRVAARLALCGATLGTLLDGIHSRVALQVYDVAPLRVPLLPGGAADSTAAVLETSLLVPPLLATWYAVMGGLVLAADAFWAERPDTQAARARAARGGAAGAAAAYGLLAANLQLSATLYSGGDLPHPQIAAVLAATWAATWWLLDRTRQGALLSVVCAVGAPLAELALMAWGHTWRYPRGDLQLLNGGAPFVSFVPCCYGGYVPVLALLTRHLRARALGLGGGAGGEAAAAAAAAAGGDKSGGGGI